MLRFILFTITYYISLIPLCAQMPVMVKDINPGGADSGIKGITNVNGVIFFRAYNGNGYMLCRSDGTTVGTYFVDPSIYNPGPDIASANELAILRANGTELWRSDGTPTGSYMVKDIYPRSGPSVSGQVLITTVNDAVYFQAKDDIHGAELWRSNGTSEGTYMVKDIYPGRGDTIMGQIASVNNIAYFSAHDSIHGQELWRSDGTEGGTYLVKDVIPGPASFNIFKIKSINGVAFFAGDDSANEDRDHGYELWRSDGTEGGTYLVKDINPGSGNGFISEIGCNNNGVAFFTANDGIHGDELWRSDGTAGGTYLVKDINPGSGNGLDRYDFKGFISVDHVVYFNANDGIHGSELWRSDGTAGGTYLVKDINSGSADSRVWNPCFASSNNLFYFRATDRIHGLELWRSDGTTDGTFIVQDIFPGIGSGASGNSDDFDAIANVDGVIYFVASDGVHGNELWKLDGIQTQHFHQLPQSLSFQTRQLLARGNDFKVCADGSEASIFKVSGGEKDYSQAVIKIPGADVSQIGSFSVIQQNKDSLIVRYKHPDYIQTLGSSATLVAGVYSTSASTTPLTTFDLTVYRAPVLMVHGLWSGSESFEKMESELVNSFLYPSSPKLIRRADYSTTNSLAFAANVPKIKTEAELLIKSARDAGVAAGNVDYVGHSMGGILGRLYLQGDTYQCGFHKLITVNTPHSGSQLANLLTKGVNAIPKPAGILCRDIIPIASYATGDACGSGAIDNLRVDSPEITSTLNGIRRNYRTVPSHAIATVDYQTVKDIKDTFFGEGEPVQKPDGSYDALKVPKKVIKAIGTANEAKDIIALADISAHLLLDIGSASLFDGPNDYVVSQVSQQGGMTGNCTTTIENQAHTGSPENDQVIDRVKALLVAAPSSVSFCQYFNPININKPVPPLIIPNGTIAVTSPKVGLRLQPGAQGVLNGNGTDLTEIRAVIEYSSTEILTVKATGNAIVCNFPVGNETGLKRVVITGKTASGGYVSDTTYFYVGYGLTSGTCESVQSGDWTSSTTWSCGHEPTATDLVTINPGHTVTISTGTAQASRIMYNGGKIIFATTSAKVFLKGGD